MACDLRGGTPKTDALPTPTDWLAIYREQLSEKNRRIAELEAALREIAADGEGEPPYRFEMVAIARAALED
jgi:hypothetical protein